MATHTTRTRAPRRRRAQRRYHDDRPEIWVGYGKLVKLFRERAGMTQEELAETIDYSTELVGAVEQGRRPAKDTFTRSVERVLEANGVLSTLQEDVDVAKLPRFFQDFALTEAEAVSRFSYDPLLIPGLLQTEEYARVLISGRRPTLPEELVEQHVEARLSRQKLLTRVPVVDLSFILDEHVLHRAVGGPEVMRTQLRRLLEVGEQRNVELQVMPADRGFHQGLNGPFVLLETEEHQRVGYVESQGMGMLVTDPEMVSALSLRYGMLRTEALSTEESARFVERLAGEV